MGKYRESNTLVPYMCPSLLLWIPKTHSASIRHSNHFKIYYSQFKRYYHEKVGNRG